MAQIAIQVTHLQDDGTTRGGDDIFLPPVQQDKRHKTKDTCGNEEGSPITVVTSDERRGDGSTSSNVDSSVEIYNTNELHFWGKRMELRYLHM